MQLPLAAEWGAWAGESKDRIGVFQSWDWAQSKRASPLTWGCNGWSLEAISTENILWASEWSWGRYSEVKRPDPVWATQEGKKQCLFRGFWGQDRKWSKRSVSSFSRTPMLHHGPKQATEVEEDHRVWHPLDIVHSPAASRSCTYGILPSSATSQILPFSSSIKWDN